MGHADLAETGAGCGIQLCSLSAMDQIDPVHIFHQLNGLSSPDIFIERAAEIIGDVVLTI